MSLDSIKTKSKPTKTSKPISRSKILIPIIIIIVIIAVIWLIVLRHNFSRINSKNQEESESSGEINQALEDLTQKLDELKEQKIFTQSTSSQETTSIKTHTGEPSTNGYPYPSEEIPDDMPPQQY